MLERRPVGRGNKAHTSEDGTKSTGRDVPTVNMAFSLI
jgi:hypothetical protein